MTSIIPIISGKGGVGKSTIAVNLAIALASAGKSVGLIDGDFYGPSVPTLMGSGEVIPDEEGKLLPPVKFGVKYISIAFFLQHQDDPVIWRGPMFNKALTQMFDDVRWEDPEYLIVDMPPGTGDAQLSLAQLVQLAGAVVVTTPQEVALADVRKAINMMKKVNVDILGLVENMSGFTTPDGKTYSIFGEGGGRKLAEAFNIPLLASIPIDPGIREGGDSAMPIVCGSSSTASVFHVLSAKIIEIIGKKANPRPSLKILT